MDVQQFLARVGRHGDVCWRIHDSSFPPFCEADEAAFKGRLRRYAEEIERENLKKARARATLALKKEREAAAALAQAGSEESKNEEYKSSEEEEQNPAKQ
jgi:hypothetical protein